MDFAKFTLETAVEIKAACPLAQSSSSAVAPTRGKGRKISAKTNDDEWKERMDGWMDA